MSDSESDDKYKSPKKLIKIDNVPTKSHKQLSEF